MTKPYVLDKQADNEFAYAGENSGILTLAEVRPNGYKAELAIDARASAPVYTLRAYDKTKTGLLHELLSMRVVPDLRGLKQIRVRSSGCAKIAMEDDDNYSLNYGAPGYVLRLKIGTESKQSVSKFYTQIILASARDAWGEYQDGSIITFLPCSPPHAASYYLSELANRLR